MQIESKIETTMNIRTGLLGKMELLIDIDYYYSTGGMHLLIDRGYATTEDGTTPDDGTTVIPYAWSLSLLGFSAIAIILVIVKRKRK